MSGLALHIEHWQGQFRGLDGRHPGLWPSLPRALCAIALWTAVVVTGGWLVWAPQWETLASGEQAEQQLRADFERKFAQSQNLDSLRRQKHEIQALVQQLERQLPDKSEMDALLAEISQAGVARGLQFELFKPGQPRLGEFHAELPIEIRLTGGFHAFAGFVSDVANMPRIVTLDRIAISQQREGPLTFDCVAHAFRYLEPAEVAQRRQAAGAEKKGRS